MPETPMQPIDKAENMVHKYGNMLFRICLVMLGNESDAADAVQDTVVKYLQRTEPFESAEHEKAWLIQVSSNQCRNMKRFWRMHPKIQLEDLQHYVSDPESCGILEALMMIPEKFRIIMMLYYVEEYHMDQIAKMIGKSVSTVKMRLQKGRKLLEETYRKEYL